VTRRRWSRAALGLACLLLAGACATLADPRRMTFPSVPLPEPEVTRVTLDNGMVLYLLPDRSLPLIHVHALIRTGQVYEPADRIGTYALAGSLLREGGAGDLDPDAFDDALAFAAIQMGSVVSSEAAGASLDTLTRTFPEALDRFADMLRRPRFDPARLENLKARGIEAIRRRDDRPESIAGRLFAKTLYGPDHPFAREAKAADIERITRDDILAFYRTWYHPNNVALGITGDFDVPDMVAAVRRAFGDWESVPVPVPVPPEVPPTTRRVIRIVHKPADQVSIRIGQVSVRRDDPDVYALNLANTVLGGNSFMSRLFQDLRTRDGLAYNIASILSPGHGHPGQFQMVTRTRPEKVGQAVRGMLAEVQRLRTEPVPPDEFAATKEAFLNSFVFNSVTPEEVVARRMRIDYYGMPPDELARLHDKTLAATAAQVLDVARRDLDPDRMVIVAVGDRQVLKEALAPFGTVEEVPWGTPAEGSGG
jgi:zinc protease